MKLLLVRHAIAEERQDWAKTGKSDNLRPLTREGRDKMRRVASAMAAAAPEIDLIASSPLTRTMQTARIVSAAYADAEIVKLESIAPDGTHEDTIAWLAKHSNLRCVAMVGHEPSLSELLTTLLVGSPRDFFEFKKGGVAQLSFSGKPAAGSAKLDWAVQPAMMRVVAKGLRA
jgi:phosphohistidine phosphatase